MSKETEPARRRISYEEFLAELLTKREAFINNALDGKITPEECAGLTGMIDDTINVVNIAENSDLMVKFYQDEMGECFFSMDKKGKGHCPFHQDDKPSFSVNVKENYWHCFAGCGGGSVIDFWMKLNNLEFDDAVDDLAERLGLKW